MKNAEGYKFFVKGQGNATTTTNNNNHAGTSNTKTQNGGGGSGATDLSAKFDDSVTPSKNP